MSEGVDQLFGKGGDAATPRVGLALVLVTVGLLLAVAGTLCTSVPGGVLVLVGGFVVQRDQDRITSGFLATRHRTRLARAERVCQLALVAVIVLEVFQVALYVNGGPYFLWAAVLGWIGGP